MTYKILIDKTGTPKLVEVPEKIDIVCGKNHGFGKNSCCENTPCKKESYEQALSTALADESKHIKIKNWQEALSYARIEDCQACANHVGYCSYCQNTGKYFPEQVIDLPENIGVSISTNCDDYAACGRAEFCLAEDAGERCTAKKLAILTPKPESVPSPKGEQEDNFYKWILTEIVEFERLKEDKSLPVAARNAYDLAFIQMKKVRQMYNDRNLTPTKH